ncbi:hypothetical protein SAMN05444411_105133 [Lutibacter oricola]|uniref:LTXXQ motif family protein n=1 Tax=Lutibacter oricola TaxID=762486 RepID=A0A1H3BL38_9FLAO|nr:hypothetical protein [Lutibacter oricola]SDX41819.1 hypothetical protein SAMN05444411_105133 [Lutibacter oricola]
MKKILVTLVLVLTVTVTFGQNKWQQKQIKYFVDAAQTEFKLDDAKTKELTSFRTDMVLEYHALQKKAKANEITKEERKEKGKEISKKFNKKLIKLTGKSYKDLAPFMDRLRKELKNLK